MIDLIKITTIGFIGYKAFSVFGKKDFGDLFAFITTLYVGYLGYFQIISLYNRIMDSQFIILIKKIFC